MRNSRELLARLDALEHRLIPPIERKIATLTASERAVFNDWRRGCSKQAAQCEIEQGRYYEMYLDGEIERPVLPYWLHDKLFDLITTVTIHMTNEQVSDAYRKFMENGR